MKLITVNDLVKFCEENKMETKNVILMFPVPTGWMPVRSFHIDEKPFLRTFPLLKVSFREEEKLPYEFCVFEDCDNTVDEAGQLCNFHAGIPPFICIGENCQNSVPCADSKCNDCLVEALGG